MKTENDENVFNYWKLHNESYFVKKDDGLDDNCDNTYTLPAHLGSSLSLIKKYE